jgi:hypothetical protein
MNCKINRLPLLLDANMDVVSRWKNTPAFSTFATSMWLGNAGAIAERVRVRGSNS